MQANLNDRYIKHWYILCYTGSHKSANKKLEAVENLQFYAPLFFMDEHCRKLSDVRSFRNYAFIFGSQDYIYQLKKSVLPNFNFMPSKSSSSVLHPYVSALDIEELRKVEQVNDGKIPFIFSTHDVVVGDKVEIISGDFAGVKANAVTKAGSKYRETYLYITDYLVIPLGKLKKGEYRIVEYSKRKDKGRELVLTASEREFLLEAMKRRHGITTSDQATRQKDIRIAKAFIEKYSNNESSSLQQRIIKHSLIAVADRIISDDAECTHNLAFATKLLEQTDSDIARLILSICRFFCTSIISDYRELTSASKKYEGKQSLTLKKFLEFTETLKDSLFNKRQEAQSDDKTQESTEQQFWFCLSAPKKKTEVIKALRDEGYDIYAPILAGGKTDKDSKKNLLKDIFFVRTTIQKLQDYHNQSLSFKVLTSPAHGILTYTDQEISDFDYVNTLDLPNKEILQFTEQQERILYKSQRRTVTLNGKDISGIIMTTKLKGKKQEKLLIPLHTVAIALQL